MKFIISDKLIRQYSYVIVKVSSPVLAQILSCGDLHTSQDSWLDRIKGSKSGCSDSLLWLFKSGAKLSWSSIANGFGIYGYADGGGDIYSAMEELKVLDSLRLAKNHYRKLAELNQTYRVIEGEKIYPCLSVSLANVDYGRSA